MMQDDVTKYRHLRCPRCECDSAEGRKVDHETKQGSEIWTVQCVCGTTVMVAYPVAKPGKPKR